MRWLVILMSFSAFSASAQSGALAFHPRTDVIASLDHPGAIAGLTTPSVGLLASRRFMLAELATYAASAGMQVRGTSFLVNGYYEGFALSHFTEAGLGFGRHLGSKIAVGARVVYGTQKTGASSPFHQLKAELGAIFFLSSQVRVALAEKIVRELTTEINTGQRRQDAFSVCYQPTDRFSCAFTVRHDENQGLELLTAANYSFAGRMMLGFGINSYTGWWAGVKFRLASLQLGVWGYTHPNLGFSPGALVIASREEEVK